MALQILPAELSAASDDVYRHATQMASLVLDQTMSGAFTKAVISAGLDLCLHVLRSLSGQRANQVLAARTTTTRHDDQLYF